VNQAHVTNIGIIVNHLGYHEVGDYGDCSINNPIMNIVDQKRPAHELVAALATMSEDEAAGIVDQLLPLDDDTDDPILNLTRRIARFNEQRPAAVEPAEYSTDSLESLPAWLTELPVILAKYGDSEITFEDDEFHIGNVVEVRLIEKSDVLQAYKCRGLSTFKQWQWNEAAAEAALGINAD
jgi:hypothetical protein